MAKHAFVESEHTHVEQQVAVDGASDNGGLPNRLMTAFEVAEFVRLSRGDRSPRCAGESPSPRSDSASEEGRFHPADVLDWIRRGAPTRVS